MKTQKVLVLISSLLLVVVFLISGCNNGPVGPSTTDVKTAFSSTNSGTNAVSLNVTPFSGGGGVYTGTKDVTSGGGSVSASYSSSVDPTATAPWTVTGTITFTNWYDAASGYTISGTLSVTGSSDVRLNDMTTFPQTASSSMVGDMTLSGGPIATLSCDVSQTATIDAVPPYITGSMSGTITANGYTFDINKLQ